MKAGGVAALLTACLFGSAVHAAGCEGLMSVRLGHTTILQAQEIAAGTFRAPPAALRPGLGGQVPNFDGLPGFCRVLAVAKPSPDSNIRIEVWLPDPSIWNGELRGTGNGGLGGNGPNLSSLATALRDGFVAAGNDTGHVGNSSYALDHPEQVRDYGYRAAHEMILTAKALTRALYGRGPKLSYMAEDGGGSMAALSAAQRYPTDYDAIAVTGLASYLTHHVFAQMWIWQALHQNPASDIPLQKLQVLHQAALAACDADDGLTDGVLGDPAHCHFDPAAVQCRGVEAPDCLTAPQVEAARKIYQGPYNPRTHVEIYSPMYPGSELGWGTLGGAKPFGITTEFFAYYVFRDPTWDYRSRPVNFDSDLALADTPLNLEVNSMHPDLGAFFSRGGKLLLVGGWNDNFVPPKAAITYYRAVVAKLGATRVHASMRFFMVPGMQHGPGTQGAENFNFDTLALMRRWKEQNIAPDQLVAKHYRNGVEIGSRLVCQYPQVAYYRGSGNTEDPSSFECRPAAAGTP